MASGGDRTKPARSISAPEPQAARTRARWPRACAWTASACVAVAIAAGCGTSETSVEVVYDPDGDGPASSTQIDLRCPSDEQASACAALADVPDEVWDPVPDDAACTAIDGGPEEATIVGMVDSREVNATFNRTNGCEIDRFEAVERVVEAARSAA